MREVAFGADVEDDDNAAGLNRKMRLRLRKVQLILQERRGVVPSPRSQPQLTPQWAGSYVLHEMVMAAAFSGAARVSNDYLLDRRTWTGR